MKINQAKQCKSFSTLVLAGVISQVLAIALPQDALADFIQATHVTDVVTDNGGGSWGYEYSVFNDSFDDGYGGYGGTPLIIDWELPFFADMGISNIQSPTHWSSSIETVGVPNPATGWEGVAAWQQPGNPWKINFDNIYGSAAANPFNSNTQVVHWYCTGDSGVGVSNQEFCVEIGAIYPGNSLGGFGFDADFAPGQAPYQASWLQLPSITGDPALPASGLPNSPSIQLVPLPAAVILFGSGLATLVGIGWRRRRGSNV